MPSDGLKREHLDSPEEAVWDSLLSDGELDRRVGERSQDDPAGASEWPPERCVSVRVLQRLLTAGVIEGKDVPRRIELAGVRIVGPLVLEASEVFCALRLVGCALESLILADSVTRSIMLDDCRTESIDLRRTTIRGSLHFTQSTCTKRLNLLQAHVEGNVNLTGTRVMGSDGVALVGDRVVIERTLFLRRGFHANGEVRLPGAKVGGQLACEGGHFSASSVALNLDSASVDGGILLIEHTIPDHDAAPFATEGEIRLTAARIGGSVECGGTFQAPQRDPHVAISGTGATVAGSVVFTPTFRGIGELRFTGARIERNLRFCPASLENPGSTALDLSRTSVRSLLVFAPGHIAGRVRLVDTKVGRLEDVLARWPEGDALNVNGLYYESLGAYEGREPTVRDRLEWLKSSSWTQPYEQLAAFYRSHGHEEGARAVGLARQRRRRASLPLWRRPWGYLLDLTVGYGYRPWLALVWVLGFLIAGTILFSRLHDDGSLTARGGGAPQPTFSPVLYALDLLLPVVSLGQRNAWVATGATAQVAVAAFIVVGWILATAVAAALSGLLRRP